MNEIPYSSHITEASRPIFWNLPSLINPIVMYALFACTLLILANALFQRYALWHSGANSNRNFPLTLKRVCKSIVYILFQRKTSSERKAGLFHFFIFFGFLVLLFTTTMVLLHHDFGFEVYKGRFYLLLTILSDAFGLLFLMGVALAFNRRYRENPDKLHNTPADSMMLKLLAVLIVQGFLLEALRLHATDDPWQYYSFVGYALSSFFWAISENAARQLHFITWWFHTITVFIFIALIPYTKFFHIISSSLNLYFSDFQKPKGVLPYIGDIEKLMEDALSSGSEEFSLGIGTLADLDWKRRLDLDACTSCGRCQEVCPAYNSDKILSPKWLILDSRDHMLAVNAIKYGPSNWISKIFSIPIFKWINSKLINHFMLANSASLFPDLYPRTNFPHPVRKSVLEGIGKVDSFIAGQVMHEDVFWSCTTCRACQEVCPVNIEHVDYIVEARRNLLLIQGKAPSETQGPLRSLETQGTPLGDQSERSNWAKDLEVNFLSKGDSVEILYWIGCISSFDARKQQITKSMVKILNACGKSWGILGNLEKCTGDPARRLGDENTFQLRAKENIGTFKTVNFGMVVTHCPHCYNTLKNEYPDFGEISESPFEVVHHTTFINDLIKSNLLPLEGNLNEDVTFHDPCYLGRYNDIYEEPREILVQLGSRKITEMTMSKEKSKCCGAGGGHYWFDMKAGQRVNSQRVQQALETKATTIASACPFCMQMLEDGLKLNDQEDNIKVKDISELVADQLRV